MESAPFMPAWLESHRVDISGLEPGELIGVGHVQAELHSLLGRLHDPIDEVNNRELRVRRDIGSRPYFRVSRSA